MHYSTPRVIEISILQFWNEVLPQYHRNAIKTRFDPHIHHTQAIFNIKNPMMNLDRKIPGQRSASFLFLKDSVKIAVNIRF